MSRAALIALFLTLLTATAAAQGKLPPDLQDVRIEQSLGEQVPLDLDLRDENGQTVPLGRYFGNKPVILVIVQYRCPMLCNLVLNGLSEAVQQVPFELGREFEIVTVSFDTRETSALAAAKKASYVERYARPGAAAGWHFLTGEQPAIDRLTNAVGFHYVYDSKLDQFAHASGIMMLTPQGKIARYFYGVDFSPRDLRLGLVEASEQKIGSPVDQLLLLCYHYDPATGKYTAAAMNLVRLGGSATLVLMSILLFRLWRRGSGERRSVSAT